MELCSLGECLVLLPLSCTTHLFYLHLQGALTVVSKEPGTVKRVESQLKQVLVWALLPEDFASCLTLTFADCEPQSCVWMCCPTTPVWPADLPDLGLLCRQVIRAMYSSPPRHGAEIAELVLSDPQLFQEWKVRCVLLFVCPVPHVLFAVCCRSNDCKRSAIATLMRFQHASTHVT
jgi:hypothetical protein